jgi:hypothetical protein
MVCISLGRLVEDKGMSEKKVFDVLRRKVSYDEMMEIWEKYHPTVNPVYQICSATFERKVNYPDTTFIYEKMKVLEEYGWTLEDLAYESEKRAVQVAIDTMNAELSKVDQSVIDHARKFFPNLRITPPKIELE